jgi:hypothetical protein
MTNAEAMLMTMNLYTMNLYTMPIIFIIVIIADSVEGLQLVPFYMTMTMVMMMM